jgi:hypothetical protein
VKEDKMGMARNIHREEEEEECLWDFHGKARTRNK